MTTDATQDPLVACPFCGRREGYKLAEGDTYRWWLVQCKACGAGVAECHSDRRTQAGADLPQTWAAAHEAWNEAGKHANELRCAAIEATIEIARLRAELEEAQRERKALLDAARNWWEGYRPLRWSEEEHIAQPRVNLMTTRDGELATLVAAIAAQGDAHG